MFFNAVYNSLPWHTAYVNFIESMGTSACTDANPLNATHPFTWKGCNFWVVATWREYEILKKIFYSEWNLA